MGDQADHSALFSTNPFDLQVMAFKLECDYMVAAEKAKKAEQRCVGLPITNPDFDPSLREVPNIEIGQVKSAWDVQLIAEGCCPDCREPLISTPSRGRFNRTCTSCFKSWSADPAISPRRRLAGADFAGCVIGAIKDIPPVDWGLTRKTLDSHKRLMETLHEAIRRSRDHPIREWAYATALLGIIYAAFTAWQFIASILLHNA